MIAKAEVLQASIGISCNEQDLQDCLTDTVAAYPCDSSNQLTSSGRVDSDSANVENIAWKKDAAQPGGDSSAKGSVLQEVKSCR